jgi:hypothetical protein
MTTETDYAATKRDNQDGIERHVWGELEHRKAGAIIKVRGTDTRDEEAVVINTGYNFNLSRDANAEVFLLASSSDTQMKFALLTLPRDKQHRWGEGEGGVQNPTDAAKRLEFNARRTHVTQTEFAVGDSGAFEVDGSGNAIFRGNVTVMGSLTAAALFDTDGVLGVGVPVDGGFVA